MTSTTIVTASFAGVETKFYGPTNTKGARIRVRRTDHRQGDTVKFYSWDYGLSSQENHEFAAAAYIDLMLWHDEWVGTYTSTGYVFARLDRTYSLKRNGAFSPRNGEYATPTARTEA